MSRPEPQTKSLPRHLQMDEEQRIIIGQGRDAQEYSFLTFAIEFFNDVDDSNMEQLDGLRLKTMVALADEKVTDKTVHTAKSDEKKQEAQFGNFSLKIPNPEHHAWVAMEIKKINHRLDVFKKAKLKLTNQKEIEQEIHLFDLHIENHIVTNKNMSKTMECFGDTLSSSTVQGIRDIDASWTTDDPNIKASIIPEAKKLSSVEYFIIRNCQDITTLFGIQHIGEMIAATLEKLLEKTTGETTIEKMIIINEKVIKSFIILENIKPMFNATYNNVYVSAEKSSMNPKRYRQINSRVKTVFNDLFGNITKLKIKCIPTKEDTLKFIYRDHPNFMITDAVSTVKTLHDHQREFINMIYTHLRNDDPSFLMVYNAMVGAGKTMSVAALAALANMVGRSVGKKLRIVYSTPNALILEGVRNQLLAIGKNTPEILEIAQNNLKGKHFFRKICYDSTSKSTRSKVVQDTPDQVEALRNVDVVIGDITGMITWLKFSKKLQAGLKLKKETAKPETDVYEIFIVDEIFGCDVIDSDMEHYMGMLFAMMPPRFVLLSASLEPTSSLFDTHRVDSPILNLYDLHYARHGGGKPKKDHFATIEGMKLQIACTIRRYDDIVMNPFTNCNTPEALEIMLRTCKMNPYAKRFLSPIVGYEMYDRLHLDLQELNKAVWTQIKRGICKRPSMAKLTERPMLKEFIEMNLESIDRRDRSPGMMDRYANFYADIMHIRAVITNESMWFRKNDAALEEKDKILTDHQAAILEKLYNFLDFTNYHLLSHERFLEQPIDTDKYTPDTSKSFRMGASSNRLEASLQMDGFDNDAAVISQKNTPQKVKRTSFNETPTISPPRAAITIPAGDDYPSEPNSPDGPVTFGGSVGTELPPGIMPLSLAEHAATQASTHAATMSLVDHAAAHAAMVTGTSRIPIMEPFDTIPKVSSNIIDPLISPDRVTPMNASILSAITRQSSEGDDFVSSLSLNHDEIAEKYIRLMQTISAERFPADSIALCNEHHHACVVTGDQLVRKISRRATDHVVCVYLANPMEYVEWTFFNKRPEEKPGVSTAVSETLSSPSSDRPSNVSDGATGSVTDVSESPLSPSSPATVEMVEIPKSKKEVAALTAELRLLEFENLLKIERPTEMYDDNDSANIHLKHAIAASRSRNKEDHRGGGKKSTVKSGPALKKSKEPKPEDNDADATPERDVYTMMEELGIDKPRDFLKCFKALSNRTVKKLVLMKKIVICKKIEPEFKVILEMISKRMIDVIFTDDYLSRGVNLPIGTMVFTESVENEDIDTILQMSGRVGRYGQESRSVNYMSQTLINRINSHFMNATSGGKRFGNFTNLYYRTLYYMQDDKEKDVPLTHISADETKWRINKMKFENLLLGGCTMQM